VALVLGTALVQSLEHYLIALPAIVLVGGYYALLMTLLAMLVKGWWEWERERSARLPAEPVAGLDALDPAKDLSRGRVGDASDSTLPDESVPPIDNLR